MNKRVLRGYLQTYLVSVIYQKKMDGEWALPFVELRSSRDTEIPVSPADAFKPTFHPSFFDKLLES